MANRLDKILIVIIIGIVLFMSAGYSVLNKELLISGELIYRAEADIRVTNVKLDGVNNTIEDFSPEFSKDEVILGFDMQSDTSTITYKIEVTNLSNVEMGIFEIEGLPATYEIKDYVLKEKLVDSTNNSKSGMVKEFTIVLKANSNFKNKQNLKLKIDFEPIYRITYDGFSNTTTYEKEVIKGETLRNTFTEDVGDILITMNDKTLFDYDNHNDYQFINKELVLENVNGNILIENNTPNAPALNGDMIPVYYDEEVNDWRKADINNLNNNWYDYSKQQWANAVTVYENNIKDLSGNGNNGAVHGATISNGEASFDGVDDYIDCGLANYDFKNTFSAKIRFKLESYPTSTTPQFSILGNQEVSGVLFDVRSNKKIYFYIYDGSEYKGLISDPIEINKWYEIVATYDGQNIKMQLNDGSKVLNYEKTFDKSANIKISTMPFYIGENPQPHNEHYLPANISVSYINLYDRTISEEEITSNNIKRDNLLLEYDFKNINTRSGYLNAPVGEIIPITDINTMWVWIPRYSYTIKSEDKTNYYGRASFGNNNPTRLLPGAIDIKFVSNKTEEGKAQYTGNKIDNYRTNDAFNFDSKTSAGIWIAKFEITGNLSKANQACVDEACDVGGLSILPNKVAITSQTVSSFFFAARSMQMHNSNVFGFNPSIGNLHMIKNGEWGAAAYLSQSRYGKYGNDDYTGMYKEVYQNKSNKYITGSSNGTPSQEKYADKQYEYNDMTNLQKDDNGYKRGYAGVGASTTGTIYGVYDMSGGSCDYTMGVLQFPNAQNIPITGNSITSNSGFSGKFSDGTDYDGIDFLIDQNDNIIEINKKYYDLYTTNDSVVQPSTACNNGVCYGQVLSETFNWYGDTATTLTTDSSWIRRGDHHGAPGTVAGIFSFYPYTGGSTVVYSTRYVLV